jgi:hypothetical protein
MRIVRVRVKRIRCSALLSATSSELVIELQRTV